MTDKNEHLIDEQTDNSPDLKQDEVQKNDKIEVKSREEEVFSSEVSSKEKDQKGDVCKREEEGKDTSKNISKSKLADISHSITDLSVKEIVLMISYIAYPVALTYFSIYMQQTIILSFIGHKYDNNAMIEGIGISNLYVNCFLLTIANGLVSGFDTLGSNALGVNNIKLLGYYYHRAFLVAYTFGTTFVIINFFVAVKLIGLLGLDDEIMKYCESYIEISMFFILFDILFNLNFRYLNVVDRAYVNIVVMVGTTALHPLWCYIFINILDMDVKGGAIALIITQFLNAILGFLYIYFYTPYPESMFCFDKESISNWGEFLKISLPATFLLCAEYWAFEFLAIVAIISGEMDYTLYIMGNNFLLNLYSICLGFGVSVTILSGKFISQNRISLIKKIKNVAIIYGVSVMVLVGIVLLILKDQVFKIFSSDPIIIEKGGTIVLLIAGGIIFDIFQASIQGYYRGVGKHLIASLLCFLNFYVFMLGMAFLFTLALDMGVNGIFLAYLVSIALTGIAYTFIEFSFDYDQLFREALGRVKMTSRRVSLCDEIDVEKETYDKIICSNLSTHKVDN